jgi:tetratricopeptide (TPR) repeat protein
MRVNKEDISDFDYLAEQGFARVDVASADIRDLSKRVRWQLLKRYFLKVFFTASLVAISTVIFLIFNLLETTNKNKLAINSKPIETQKNNTVIKFDSCMNSETISENFEKINSISVFQANNDEQTYSEDTLRPMNLEVKMVQFNLSLNNLHPKIDKAINSLVTYIHQLKVSNYHSLYFNRKRGSHLKSLTSNFEDWKSKTVVNKQMQEIPVEFLHDKFKNALWSFREQDYSKSIPLFLEILESTEDDENCFFYLGMSFFHQEDFVKAIIYFNKCVNHTRNTFAQEALYYKAISLMKNHYEEEAKIIFNEIVEGNDFYANNARHILSRMNGGLSY